MDNVYSHAEIVAFVDATLKKVGTQSMNDPSLNGAFIDMISKMPPAWQVLFIETRHDNIVADQDDLNRLYQNIKKEDGKIAGFFYGGEKVFDNFRLKYPVFFQREGRGNLGAVTARHEKAHDVDAILGAWVDGGKHKGKWFSALNEDWQEALSNEVNRQCRDIEIDPAEPDDVLEWTKEKLSVLIAAQVEKDDLYDDYSPLLNHLSYYDTKHKRIQESFAEMGTHYTTLYAQTGGDKRAIDRMLTQRYPELWSQFRDDVLPRIEQLAGELLAEKAVKIAIYLKTKQVLLEENNLYYDEEKETRQAKIALAKGTLSEQMEDIGRLFTFYKDPVNQYALASRECDDVYFDCDPDSVSDVDDSRERARAMRILQAKGYEALADAYLHIEHEKLSFQKFLKRYDSIMNVLSPKYDAKTYFKVTDPHETPVTAFRKIHRKGGEDAVNRHLENLPTLKAVEEFKKASVTWEELRHAVSGKTAEQKKSPTQMGREVTASLQHIIESGRYNDIVVRTSAIKEETDVLKQFSSAFCELAIHVAGQTNSCGAKPTGQDILDRYEKIRAKNGLDGLREKTEDLKTTQEAIKVYADTRKNHWDWARQVAEFGRKTEIIKMTSNVFLKNPREIPPEILSKIAAEIMTAVYDGGQKLLESKAQLFQERIRQLKREAQGLSPISKVKGIFSSSALEDDADMIAKDVLRTVAGNLRRYDF